jgi:ribonucleotide monophosphatase NagD (HAD superfamily)
MSLMMPDHGPSFQAVTGYEHPHVQYGKPTKDTYDFARDALQSHFQQHYGLSSAVPNLWVF